MRMPASLKLALPLLVWLAFFSTDASAQMNSSGLFDDVLNRYNAAASGWAGVITNAASWLFWLLVTISMVWTFGMMALRKADIGEFFAELVRFTIFTGFFWWLLTNGPNFASTIYASLRQIAGNATGLGQALSPSGIVDIGFAIFYKVMDQSSVWSPVDSMAGILMAVAILIVLALIGVNMLLLLASGWVLAYGGVFFLGFGGSRWTSDMAINYYKTVLGVAAQLMAMVLLVGIGKTFLDDYYARMSEGINLKEMGVMLIVCVILLALVNKIPALIAGVITGASVGGAGIGNFGAGAALGAAGMAAAAAATGGAALAAGAASAAGGASAVMAAFSKANENVSSGSDVMSMLGGGGGGDSGGGGGGGGEAGTSTPLGQAAGFGGGGGDSGGGGSGGGESKGGDKGGDKAGSSSKGGEGGGQKASGGGDAGGAKAGQGGGQQGQGAGQGGQQDAPGSTGPGMLASAASALGKAGRVTADAGANLAKGVGAVAAAKAAGMRDSAMERIADTTGGKIAAAIKAQGGSSADTSIDVPDQQPSPTFGDNSLAGADSSADPESEVAAFRDAGRNDKSA
ncbi:MAG: P-type conjugative transfer protein TrbL [Gallionellaceae bacterium]|uniref:P-type conjugative transfer protein TrbL n=1 Tax=Pseudomonas aeruginosa TaxID=287 RepID=UPI00027F00AE|nr:P-type conjugative transfer protein TrbL [Pseudomonas aeruginosa]AFR43798.1 mating pair formation protein [uncultured bacterium]MDD5367274.1 P-type conjugative transfer protein TrbL [Gallionellaceae bacterium]